MKSKNIEQLKKNLEKRLVANPNKNSLNLIDRATRIVQNTAIKSLMAGGTGETVTKYNPNRTHTQSKPLDAPASDTGFLVSQITMNVKSNPDGSVVGSIISAAPYSKALEFGTTNMTERPFMQPALEKNKRKIQGMFKKQGLIK
tara:strand:+ start:44 stop:475 length:432 start_codon:yes stop_codon:yes gene_type:complete